MGFFDRFKKQSPQPIDFQQIDATEKALDLVSQGLLQPFYLMPPRFGGEESISNRVFTPPAAVEAKDRFDDKVEALLMQGKVQGYTAKPEYRGKSIVPCRITVTATKDGSPVLTETFEIW